MGLGGDRDITHVRGTKETDNPSQIDLQPFQIRTFELNFEEAEDNNSTEFY